MSDQKEISPPAGPWTEDIEKNGNKHKFVYKGYACSAGRSFTLTWTGYVHLPETHPDYDKDDIDDFQDIGVHGGVSWAEKGCIGFDCCHQGDIVPMDVATGFDPYEGFFSAEPAKYWTLEDVIDEIKHLADQLIERARK